MTVHIAIAEEIIERLHKEILDGDTANQWEADHARGFLDAWFASEIETEDLYEVMHRLAPNYNMSDFMDRYNLTDL